ncbi:cellulose biosynthesis cyclic di-GMP-binding regulatory protein BcsB [Algiphilus sp.]|uniref:cellulose biosynthesis cyclic di-GMP-binding regulatory protein BcsB n=1 Tax=Algiphilus sp. TaxID=1872431 RepID=UPI003B51FB49
MKIGRVWRRWALALLAVVGSLSVHPAVARTIDFEQMGGGEPVRLGGLDREAVLNFGIPRDEAIVAATLDLQLAMSPALLPQLSHVNVRLNGRFVGTVTAEDPRREPQITRSLPIDPRLFGDYNQLALEFVGHYTERCQSPAHSSLWVQISPDSRLELATERLNIRQGLSALPVPFFDQRDNRPLVLPFVFGTTPTPSVLTTAAMVSGWFGQQAGYRGARFPVALGELPDQHAVLLVTNDTIPEDWTLEPVEAPTVSVIADPEDARFKRLVLQGADEKQLRMAAHGLLYGKDLLTGQRAVIDAIQPPQPRPMNDVPAWVATDRPIRLGDLVDRPELLQVRGYRPDPITLNARIPPDLYTGFYEGVDMDLRYRYTRPSSVNDSRLSVFVNDRFVQSLALAPDPKAEDSSRIRLPLLDRDRSQARDALRLPAFQLGIDNRLQFAFSHDYRQGEECASEPAENVYSAIDPDSTIDLTGFPRHAPMPDLALFANAGYPFTRYADLSQTTVVLPDRYGAVEMEVMLGLVGRLSALSGLAGARVSVTTQSALDQPDSDLLMIGTAPQWLSLETDSAMGAQSPLLLSGAQRQLQAAADRAPGVRTTVRAEGDLGVLLGFASPFADQQSVVAVAGNSEQGLRAAFDALTQPRLINSVRYGVSLVAGEQVRPIDVGHSYALGTLTWWQRIWLYFAGHPLLMSVLAVIAGLMLAALAFWMLRGVAAARTRA